uniref:Uncharacterized protein n=1 Tax=Vespula pensylvanica TaxID=30213 RepID=A0A834U985_VESPE|nr:hypothetical protein H0235_008513 [Vespula pensylvanica]
MLSSSSKRVPTIVEATTTYDILPSLLDEDEDEDDDVDVDVDDDVAVAVAAAVAIAIAFAVAVAVAVTDGVTANIGTCTKRRRCTRKELDVGLASRD